MAFNCRIYDLKGNLLFNMHSELINQKMKIEKELIMAMALPVRIEFEETEDVPFIVDGDDL